MPDHGIFAPLTVTARLSSGALGERHFDQAQGIWTGWRSLPGTTATTSPAMTLDSSGRMWAFACSGGQVLFRRCKSNAGRHDFAAGYLAPGPNAFVHCEASDARQFSGPIESWASGVLYDNVTIDGGGLALTNRETDAAGTGWAAANSVLWQCSAPVITCLANKSIEAGAPFSFDQPTATDVGGTNSISIVSTVTNTAGCSYSVVRTWRATDACGNRTTCVSTITWSSVLRTRSGTWQSAAG